MAFLWYGLYANGSMFFDVATLAPMPDIALQFTTQSFGNGTLDLRFKGPSALGITADGASQVLSSAHGNWGDGVEIIYTNLVSADLLVINYRGTGPGPCWPYCDPAIPDWLRIATIPFLLLIISTAFLATTRLAQRRATRQKSEEHHSGSYSKS